MLGLCLEVEQNINGDYFIGFPFYFLLSFFSLMFMFGSILCLWVIQPLIPGSADSIRGRLPLE